MLIGRTPHSRNPIWRRTNRKYPSRSLSFVADIISRSSRAHINKIPTAIPMFSISGCSNGVIDDVTGSRIMPEIDMEGVKTEVTLSQHIEQLETKFRHIRPYFRCRPVQRRCRQHNRSRVIPAIHIAVAQTGIITILPHSFDCPQYLFPI